MQTNEYDKREDISTHPVHEYYGREVTTKDEDKELRQLGLIPIVGFVEVAVVVMEAV